MRAENGAVEALSDEESAAAPVGGLEDVGESLEGIVESMRERRLVVEERDGADRFDWVLPPSMSLSPGSARQARIRAEDKGLYALLTSEWQLV